MTKGRPLDPARDKRGTGHRPKAGTAKTTVLAAVPVVGGGAPAVKPVPDPPEHLPEAMHPTWRAIVELIGERARDEDLFVIEGLVRSYWRMVETGEMASKLGPAIKTPAGGIAVNPFIRAERDATTAFVRMAESYGLTLASRMRLGLMQLAGQTLHQALAADLED